MTANLQEPCTIVYKDSGSQAKEGSVLWMDGC